MRVLQEVLFKLTGDYTGHPYYVPGHALWTAISREVDFGLGFNKDLCVSTGVFVPGAAGEYPPEHSQDGSHRYMGTGLRSVETYDDLFLFRDGAHRWMSDFWPRDAQNTHEVRSFGGRLTFSPTRRFGRGPESRDHQRTMDWYLHCFIHLDNHPNIVAGLSEFPVEAAVLDGLRLGGGRNYGFGEVELVESRTIDLRDLDYSRIEAADSHRIELLSPYVLRSEFSGADAQTVPWWWGVNRQLRKREERLVDGDDVYAVETVDHGQVFAYSGDRPVETAKNGVNRVGTHSKYGFGELRIRPATDDRVTERQPSQAPERSVSDSG